LRKRPRKDGHPAGALSLTCHGKPE
jgi:hypothetical protein